MPVEKREAIDYLVREHALSICTACRCVRLSRSAWYRPLVDWRARDGAVIEALSGLAGDKPGGKWRLCRQVLRKDRKRTWCVQPKSTALYLYLCSRQCPY